ncbi:hypothetical protein B4923_16345 [Brenneria roseae subsp. americana]|uniref:Morphogenetic protein n=1 Tax=Brenneria roseae subsp. americana TaxID=1508507 RepID=A0A2U1TMT3_9GAMM|nr:hypothetical protein [Brenneria roseae]PWC10686.1 hypothetical protein B4923_16345 [Brenneria roseae subsp. americana]
MKERGIIFNADMVRAILSGHKTQTRRPVKFPVHDINMGCELAGNELAGELSAGNYSNCPFGQLGDRLWVREKWGVVSHDLDASGRIQEWIPTRPATPIREMPFGNGYYSGHVIYAADGEFTWGDDDGFDDGRSCWKPSIHMPRRASRITLEITDVRVEKLKHIPRDGIIAEGYPAERAIDGGYYDPFLWYRNLWESLYGAGSWQANPWIWVISFKRIEGNS